MTQDSINEIARKIIKENIYLTLGTTDGNTPWVAPLFYAVSDTNVFYFTSQLNSVHTINMLKNPLVSFAIFHSNQREGTGNGVQGSGKVYRLPDEELPEAFKWYHTTFIEMKTESFQDPAPYRFFKLIPEKMYILDTEADTDKRVEVKI